jgi:rhamnogalacturonyl hydrolase YesR
MTLDRRTFLTSMAAFVTSPASAGESPAPAGYQVKAEQVMGYIQRTLWDADAKRYRPATPPEPNALPYDFMWANGIMFSALVGGAHYDSARYRPLMEAFFDGLNGYWDGNALIPAYDAYLSSPGHSDKYYDDNEWMVLTFAEAYALTGDRRYLDRAAAAQRFIVSGWDDRLGGGVYWRQDHRSKNTCSNGPAAASALALAPHLNPTYHVEWARRIVAWTSKTLQSPDGTFWDNIALDGKVERTKWTYNTALMLRANVGLYRVTGKEGYLAEAQRLARASVQEFVNPKTGAFRDEANFSHLLVEALLDLYRETKEPYLLDNARRNAAFIYRYVRDPKDDGYWLRWEIAPERKEERKTLMANASVARLFWLLAPYLDVDELVEQGRLRLAKGDRAGARRRFEEAAAGDPESALAREALQSLGRA